MPDILTAEPLSFVAGTFVQWSRQLPYYPAGSGWALFYALVKPGKLITFNATQSGDLPGRNGKLPSRTPH
jgi:hypothetical protein